jgi:hypothetical protein
MIWFACKQCGKRHGRAEGLAGTMVFCECGRGNRVPWSSTAPEPDPSELPPPPVPRSPLPEQPSRPSSAPPPRWAPPAEQDNWQPPHRSTLRHPREGRRPDPRNCLNHDADAEKTCDDCRCSFCSACVVRLQDRTLCGPCKNFRIRGLHRPARTSPMSIIALITALVSCPVCFFISLMAIGMYRLQGGDQGGAVGLCLVALVLPTVGLVLGCLALRDVERSPAVGGRSLAVAGTVAAGAGVMWALMVTLIIFSSALG